MQCPYLEELLEKWDGVCNPMGEECYNCNDCYCDHWMGIEHSCGGCYDCGKYPDEYEDNGYG